MYIMFAITIGSIFPGVIHSHVFMGICNTKQQNKIALNRTHTHTRDNKHCRNHRYVKYLDISQSKQNVFFDFFKATFAIDEYKGIN